MKTFTSSGQCVNKHRLVFNTPEESNDHIYTERGTRVEGPVIDISNDEQKSLRRSVGSQIKKIREVKQTITDGEATLAELEKRKESIQAEIDRLNGENSSLTETMTALEQELKNLTKEEERIKTTLVDLKDKIDKIEENIKKFETKLAEYERDVIEKNAEQQRYDEQERKHAEDIEKAKRNESLIESARKSMSIVQNHLSFLPSVTRKAKLSEGIELGTMLKARETEALRLAELALEDTKKRLEITRSTLLRLNLEIGESTAALDLQRESLRSTKASETENTNKLDKTIPLEREKVVKVQETTKSKIDEVLESLKAKNTEEATRSREEAKMREDLRKAIDELPNLKNELKNMLPTLRLILENPDEILRKVSNDELKDFFGNIQKSWAGMLDELEEIANKVNLPEQLKQSIANGKLNVLGYNTASPQETINTYLSKVSLQKLTDQVVEELKKIPGTQNPVLVLESRGESSKAIEEALRECFPEYLILKGKKIEKLHGNKRKALENLVKAVEASIA